MTTINVAGLPSSRKTPGVYLAVVLGGTPTSAAAATKKILLIGNKITTNLTFSSPAHTAVTAGTAANATPTAVYSADEAATYFGRGSELHRMALAAFNQYPDAQITACASAESSGARGTGVLTFATTASAAFTVRFKLNGKTIDVAVASGDTATAIASACATAILDQADLPVTAQNSTGALTISSKHPGPRANDIVVWAAFVASDGTETIITTGSTTSPGTTTGILSGVTTIESSYFLSGGTTADTITTALAAVVTTKYDRIVTSYRDTTAVDEVAAQVDSMAGVTTQKRQQFIYGYNGSAANAITLATGRNDVRGQCVWHYNSPNDPCELGAQVAAARLIGDSYAGGTLVGEATDPAANLDGLELRDIVQQHYVGERPTSTEIESALANGVCVLQPSTLNPGKCNVVRSITTKSTANGMPSYSNLDTTTVTVPDYAADDLQSDLTTVYRGKKLTSDTSDGSPPTAANVIRPTDVKNRIAYKLKTYEDSGIVRDVDANLALLQVVENSGVAGRLDCEIPVEPMPGVHLIGGNVRQV